MEIFNQIKQDLSDEIKLVNDLILSQIAMREELIATASNHLIMSGGKRLRPILVILSSKMLGYNGDLHIKLAAAVELIHTATLLHDDVVDESTSRRNRPTVNSLWGNKASILVGDFLISQAFILMVETGSLTALDSLSKASMIIAEGEVMQLTKLKEQRILKNEEYHQIIQAKTAALFGAACEIGALITASQTLLGNSTKLKEFGIILGNIFQITDDFLDYFGNSAELGKDQGADFFQGKVTLPLILLNQEVGLNEKNILQNLMKQQNRSIQEFEMIVQMMRQFNIQTKAITYISSLKSKALKILNSLECEKNIYYQHLINLVEFAYKRIY